MTFKESIQASSCLLLRPVLQTSLACILALAAPYGLALPNDDPMTADADPGMDAIAPLEARQNLDLHWHRFYIGKQKLVNFVESSELLGRLNRDLNLSAMPEHAGSFSASLLPLTEN